MATKNFVKSKTIIGTLLVILSMVLPLIGVDFSAAEASSLSTKIGALMDASMEIIGLILIVWGRFAAKTVLTVLPGRR